MDSQIRLLEVGVYIMHGLAAGLNIKLSRGEIKEKKYTYIIFYILFKHKNCC